MDGSDRTGFFDNYRRLLEKERDAEIEQTALLLTNCSPKLLERKGLAMTGLRVANVNIGLGGKSMIELSRHPSLYNADQASFPPHSFRPGDIARVGGQPTASKKPSKAKGAPAGGEGEKNGVEGVIFKVTEKALIVAVDAQGSGSDDIDLPDLVWLVKLANNATFERMAKTWTKLEDIVSGQTDAKAVRPETTRLIGVLLGIHPPSSRQPIQTLEFFDSSLNGSQKEAVRFVLESPEVACIHGPPGTGKTHTLIEVIRQILKTNAKVLVCGASNLSVDNLLERLLLLPKTSDKPVKCTRIGHPARVKATGDAVNATLDYQTARSDQAELVRDIKSELEQTLQTLSGKAKGQKGKAPRGAERRKMWDEVRELRKEYRKRESDVVQSVLKEAQVVLATCHSSGGKVLFGMNFDVVIIDEATQALEAACWVPALKGKKLILAGDPNQLPPTILSTSSHSKEANLKEKPPTSPKAKAKSAPTENPPGHSSPSSSEGSSDDDAAKVKKDVKSPKAKSDRPRLRLHKSLEVTLFDRLEKMFGPSIKRMLQVQYRMHDDICAFPAQELYGSKLKADPSVASHLLKDLPNLTADGTDENNADVLSPPVVFFDTAGCEYFEKVENEEEGSRCNENEATIVVNWIEGLIAASVMASQIAIITPYQAQVALLSATLHAKYPDLEIGSVDGMQGREKEAVILTLVRSNKKREVGFLKDKRRLNVAMTRARRQLCVIGDSSTIKHGSKYLHRWMDWLEAKADIRYGGLE